MGKSREVLKRPGFDELIKHFAQDFEIIVFSDDDGIVRKKVSENITDLLYMKSITYLRFYFNIKFSKLYWLTLFSSSQV